MTIVVDASAVVDLLLHHPRSLAVREAIAGASPWHAPHLVDVEVLHALRRWATRGELCPAAADAAWEIFDDLPLVRHGHAPLRALSWSLRDRLSAYDAAYVSLAVVLQARLVTADARLARGAAGLVEVSVAA